MDFNMFAQIFGGIGFFLLGMSLMTDGLKSVAGDSLRTALQRFTKGPVSGTVTGAVVTAIVQSSSATTLATIGFVSAGLLPFVNAIGLIFGANIGTTTTGWMVSLLGLKFSISSFALPFIGVGALLQLFGRGKLRPTGYVLVGFGLIFVAVSTLQEGMGALADQIDVSHFGAEGMGGRIILVLVGVVMTIILQSSTVALVTTMTALHTGTLDLVQAAALVVGQNVGTTFTALLASIGASIPAKRTAIAHVLFNVITALLAFGVLPFFVHGVDVFTDRIGYSDDAVALAAFHTAFSLLGILVILPFTGAYARLIERLVPEKNGSKMAGLDMSSAEIPAVALEAARNALQELHEKALAHVPKRVQEGREEGAYVDTAASIHAVRAYLSKVATRPSDDVLHARHVMLLRVADHLESLLDFFDRPNLRVGEEAEVREMVESVLELLAFTPDKVEEDAASSYAQILEDRSETVANYRRVLRRATLSRFAAGELSAERADQVLEDIGWLDRIAYHSARATYYMQSAP